MKKSTLLITSMFVLTGCVTQINKALDDVKNIVATNSEPLYAEQLCNAKKNNSVVTAQKYSGKKYLFNGILNTVQQNQNTTVLGLKTSDNEDIWAKVDNYSGQLKGSNINVVGVISPSNFNDANRYKCHVLLDDAKIQ